VPRRLQSFVRRIRWFNFTFLVLIPLAGFIQALWVPLRWQTLLWSAVYYVLTAGSITTGE
jgi:stearoyl-CoA desaturase (delta-9 desaturase)